MVATLVLAGCALLAGCGPATPSATIRASAVVPATVGPPASSSGPSSQTTASGSAVVADLSLLGFVPGAGITLTYDPDTTARVAADPTLAASASALAIALALPAPPAGAGPSASASADLAVVSVIRLRDPSVGDAWFQGWRESYDEAACANAGGVTRRAETDIAGVTVFVGSCAGGSFTYHVRTGADAVVISLTSVGPGRLGQKIMEGLAP